MITIEHVHAHGGDLRVGGRTGVAAGVVRCCVLHQQIAGGGRALLRHHRHAAARRVVRYHLLNTPLGHAHAIAAQQLRVPHGCIAIDLLRDLSFTFNLDFQLSIVQAALADTK